MSYIASNFRHPGLAVNALNYTRRDYEGALSTLCAGCGHDSISAAIVQACFESAIEPHRVAKLSGIGCSSKTPTYFLGKSHGFNSVHGRMPSVATGANLANRDLLYIGISGDGDTASIGMGQFVHALRRNLNMLYIVENNGCYGLTKGQDSATADAGSVSKTKVPNPYESIDLCGMAVQLNAGFVARSFSGDKEQLVPLIKAGLTHHGFSFIDILSPCVTFNNNDGSTKSYQYIREHASIAAEIGFVPEREEITAEYKAGEAVEVTLHDGSAVRLQKLAADYSPLERDAALAEMRRAESEGVILTGLLYMDTESRDLHDIMKVDQRPLNTLDEEDLCPGNRALEDINKSLR